MPTKRKKPAPDPAPRPVADIALPEKLLTTKVTGRNLTAGENQKKLLAFFAPHVLPQMFNELRRNMIAGDHQALRLAAELYSLTQKSSHSVNVLLQQNNQNVSGPISSRGDGPRSFEDISRVLAEERRHRTIAASLEPHFEPTPES